MSRERSEHAANEAMRVHAAKPRPVRRAPQPEPASPWLVLLVWVAVLAGTGTLAYLMGARVAFVLQHFFGIGL